MIILSKVSKLKAKFIDLDVHGIMPANRKIPKNIRLRSNNLANIISTNRLAGLNRSKPSLMFGTQASMRNFLQNSSTGITTNKVISMIPSMPNIKSQQKIHKEDSRNREFSTQEIQSELSAFK